MNPALKQVWHHKVFGTEAQIVVIHPDYVAVSRPLGGLFERSEWHPDSFHGPTWPTDEFLAKWWPSHG